VAPQSASATQGFCAPQPWSSAVLPQALKPLTLIRQTHVSLLPQKNTLPQVVPGEHVLVVGRPGTTTGGGATGDGVTQTVDVDVTVVLWMIVGVVVAVFTILQCQ
jgi:hypothetical protein